MDLYDALLTTRSMRRLSDEPVSDEQVLHCLRAAVQAPSGGNIQPYQFVVVTDPDKRARLGAIYLRAWERYSGALEAAGAGGGGEGPVTANDLRASDHLARHMHRTPVLVLVLVPKIEMVLTDDEGDMNVGPVYASVYPAVQNFILAARELGLGTTLTTVYRIYEDEVRDVCGIPDRFEVVALLPLGHPTGTWGVARRRPVEKLTNWNDFGNRRS